ncbi:hypothetical protein K443DRAFT_131817 [Laccaria amethystina LaAM-08-1]|uniref:SCP domain-containing protein n=1 Tax=Laccaria amethystina LaAM-08-1 TaxID=1095629 RepID=A0A0C9WTR6_9AGAR|nr:hypothetical protein K443DRAFT_131817 [Laccaria amethystina LaAM-08-1]
MQLLSLLLVSLTLAISSSASHGKSKHRLSTSPTPAAPTTTTTTTTSAYSSTTNPPAANTSIPTSTTTGNPSIPFYAGPTPTAVSKSGSAAFIADALAQHNAARALYGAPPVTWNTALYPSTQVQVDGCVFAHSVGGNWGENIYVGGPLSVESFPVMDAVNMWMGEADNHPENGFDLAGHFTNVVYKSTTQIACAVGVCAPGTIYPNVESQFVMCRYTGGNSDGFAANIGRPVTSS